MHEETEDQVDGVDDGQCAQEPVGGVLPVCIATQNSDGEGVADETDSADGSDDEHFDGDAVLSVLVRVHRCILTLRRRVQVGRLVTNSVVACKNRCHNFHFFMITIYLLFLLTLSHYDPVCFCVGRSCDTVVVSLPLASVTWGHQSDVRRRRSQTLSRAMKI